MSTTANFIVSGVLSDGTPIVFGAVPSDGTSHTAIHHVSSSNQFQVESWDGEHAEHEHHDHEEPRRFSIYLEEGGAEKSGLAQSGDQEDEEDEPIASSGQFERTRSASLAAALLELDPRGVPLVQFFKLATSEPLLEVDEGEDEVAPSEAELVLSQLLFTLRSLKMSGGDAKHSEAVQRLRELEEELRAAGAVTPADPAVSEAVARALAVAGAGRDVQIRVNQSKHTTTTKTVYETETSAMAHMNEEQIRKLQQDIIADISSGAEQHSGQDSGTTQKKETAEEGFTNEDGSVVVSKKMTRVVTTTRTTLPGEGEEPSAPDSPVESLGSVKDRIAKFEQFKTLPIDPSVSGPPPSIHALTQEDEEPEEHAESTQQYAHEEPTQSSEGRDSGRSGHTEQSIPEVHFTESDTEIEHHDDHHEESHLEPTVGIVITPHTPIPPEHPDDREEIEDEQPQEPLEPSEPEHVARAEIKDTREYSDEELAHELSPSEEHVSTAEIKDIKSYSPTSSDDERSSQKGKVSPPIPQVRHVISPSVASEVLSSHDDELAAHYVAESFEKHDEGRVETMEHQPVYRGHHSPGQTSPIVSEHPIAQEYAESVTSHDEGDNLSLKSGHEPEIARHSVASVQEEEEEKSGLGDFAKKAGMIVGGVIAAPVALAAVGAKAAYDALKKDDDDEEKDHEAQEVLTTQTTIMESPIQHEDVPPPHMEDVTPKVSHHEQPHEIVTETSTTVTREYYDEPEDAEVSSVKHSPVPSEKEQEPHLVSETTTTTTVTREFYDEPEQMHEEVQQESHSPAPSSHVQSERHQAGSPALSEQEHPHVVETTTTTTVTREYEEEEPEVEDRESVKELPHVTETTTTTTVTREYDQPEGGFDSERLSEPAHSPEPATVGTPADSEKWIPHVVETTTPTTVTREFYDEEDPEHRESSPVAHDSIHVVEEQREVSPSESPIPSERSVRSIQQHPESPAGERHSPVPSEPMSEKDAHGVTKTTTTTTVTRDYFEEPQDVSHSPAPSSHVDSEHPISESPAFSEREVPHVVETTTTTTVTRDYEVAPEHDHPESSDKDIASHVEPIPSSIHEFHHEEYPRPESPAEVYPIPSNEEQELHLVSETTTRTTVTREFYDEPEHGQEHPDDSYSPAPSSHAESAHHVSESPVASEKEHPHVVETTTTTTVTREFHDEEFDRPESPSDVAHDARSSAPASEVAEHRDMESPAVSEKEVPHVVETTTTTTVTQEVYDDDFDKPESRLSEQEHKGLDSPASAAHESYGDQPQQNMPESPHAQYFQEEQRVSEQHQPESGDESDGEGFGSKVLGFAKKAGMVAGGVVAAPVALAAVGAKAAYDALKKDDDEEEEDRSHEEPQDVLHSPAPSSHGGAEHPVLESPALSEKELPHVVETTTTTTVTREFYDEEPEHAELSQESHSPAPSSHAEPDHHLGGSSALSEQEHPHVIETSTTTTVTREFDEEPDTEQFEKSYEEKERSPSPTELQEHLVKESTTTTTVTREFYDEPEHGQEHPEDSYSPAPSSHAESAHHVPESPVESEKEHPHVVETTTTTTVTREFHDEEFDRPESSSDVAHDARSSAPASEVAEHRDMESPAVSEKEVPHVVETTTTNTTTREFYNEEAEPDFPQTASHGESLIAYHQEQDYDRAASPAKSEDGSQKHFPHVTETTTTTTVTREFDQEEGGFDSERLSEPAHSPEPATVGTPTEITREFYDEEDPEHREASPVHSEEQFGGEPPLESTTSLRGSPVPSENVEESHLVKETTTTTTVTREFYDEPEYEQDHPKESYSPAPSSHVESERHIPESPVASEKESHFVEENVEPRFEQTQQRTSLTYEDSPAAQYFHEQPEHQTESPVPTEKAPLLTEQHQPESGDESDGEGFGSKVLGFAKKAGMVAGGVVAAPVALAAVGAKAAYDALKKDDGEEETSYSQEHAQHAIPTASEKHHVTETTTTTTVTREYFDEPESHEEHGQESVAGSEHSIPHVVESTTTTTVKRDYDEEPISESPVPPEKESTTVSREVFETAQGNEPEHHYIETTTTTVQKEIYDEPEEAEDDGEPKQETPHVVETTTTTKTTREYEDDEEISESSAPHVTETTTTTTVVREFYGDLPEESEEPIDEPVSAQIDEEDAVSPDSDSTTSVSREIHTEEPHVVETTTTTVVTREYHDEPEETEESDVKETTTTTTLTREYYEDEPESPIKEHLEEDRASPVDSEKSVPQVMETTSNTTVTRQFYDEEEPEFKQTELHGESPIAHHQEQDYDRAASPEKSEEGSEKHFPHVTETTTPTTVTREFDQEEGGFDSERLSEPAHSPEPETVGTPTESEKSIPHVVETTTTTTVTREFYDEEDPEHREASPVHSEKQFGGEPPLESTTSLRGSPVPSENVEESHLVKETTTTTTVTREFYDEPEYEQDHPKESYSPAPSSHVESERHIPESPVASEKESHFVEENVEPRFEQTQQRTSLTYEDSPAAQYFHEQPEHQTESPVPTEKAPLLTEQHQPESGDESDGEGFGSKVLGFAKKAGMVAGGVVAAPVALAAVGAKAAYDALKKDDGEEETSYSQEHAQHAIPTASEKHHVTETTTTTTVTREYFDEPESHEEHGQESVAGSEHSIPHVVESTTTTTVKRDYDEEPISESPVPPEKESTTVSREVFETAQGNEPEHHYIETTTTTVQKEIYDEPEEAEDDGEPKQETPHVVETTTTTKTTREYEDDEEISESSAPHVTETTTTTTVVREFYGDLPEESEEPIDEPVSAQIDEEDAVSPDSDSTTSVSREIHTEEPHVVETTTTTVVTREYHDEPEETEESDVKETTTTTTLTREYYEDEPESPIKEHLEEDRASPVDSEKSVPQVMETTSNTTVTRQFYDEEEPEFKQTELHGESPIAHHQEQDYDRAASPEKSEEGSEKHFPHVTETTTPTTVTREFDQEEGGFDSERLSEPAHSPEPETVGTPTESEKSIPHVVETTTTTTVTREFYDEEDPEHREASPVHSEKQFGGEPPLESTTSLRGSPVPSENVEESHFVKETTTTTTVTREFYDEPEHGQEHPEESYSPAPSSHLESERHIPESPVASEKESHFVEEDIEPRFEQTQQRTSLTQEDSPAAQYFHEEPEHQTESPVPTEKAPLLTEQHQPESGDESDGEGFGSKVLGFAKKAGMVAGGVVAAPVALAAVGAKAAYDALKKDDDEEEHHALLGDVHEQHRSDSPVRSEAYHQFEQSAVPSQQAYDQESLKSPVDSEKSFRVETITTETREQFGFESPKQQRSGSASPSHKEEIMQFQGEHSSESSEKEREKESEDKKDTRPELERQGSYSPGYSPKSPRGSPAESDGESRQALETVPSAIAEQHVKPEEHPAGSPVTSEEGSTKFVETTTTTTVTREQFESEDEPTGEHVVESEQYPSGSPVPSEEDVRRVIETTTTTTVTREDYDDEQEPRHVVESREYSASESPVPSEKSVAYTIETTTTTTETRKHVEHEDDFGSSPREVERSSVPVESSSPVPSEEDVHGYMKTTTTTTTVTREHFEPEYEPIGGQVVESEEYASGSPIPSEKSAGKISGTHEPEEYQYSTSPVQSEKQSEEPSIAPYEQPTEYGRVDSHDAPASPAPSAESPIRREFDTTSPSATQEYSQPEGGFESERLSEPTQSPEPHAIHEKDREYDEPHFEQTQQRTSLTYEDSPAAQYFHEEPEHQTESPVPTEKAPLLTEQHQSESGDESEGEGFGRKVLGFAKKAGMVAGGVVAAPVALAAVGAKAAYDALKKDDDEDDEQEQHALLGDTQEQSSSQDQQKREDVLVSPKRRALVNPVSDDDSQSEIEAEYTEPTGSDSEQSHRYTETIRKTTVTREYLDDDESQHSRADSEHLPVESPSEQVVETTTTVIRHYHDEPQPEVEGEEKTLPEEVTVLREVYEAPEGDEPEHHYIETKTTTIITKEVYEPEKEDAPASPIGSEKDASEKDFPSRDTRFDDDEPHAGDTTITTVTRELYEEPEGVRPASGSEADDESHAPRYLETTTTTTVTREYEVSDEETEGEESHPAVQQREGSPAPSEESVTHVVEKTTTTTVTEERFEQEEPSSPVPSEEDAPEYVKTTTTTTTVTHERFEPEDEPTGEHVVESEQYPSGSPVPSEEDAHRIIETTTTTTVTREHYEPEEEHEPHHVVESQEHSAAGSPVLSEKSTPSVTAAEQSSVHAERSSPVPSEEDIHGYMKTTTTTTTVTHEHFEPEDELTGEHVVESEEYSPASPIPSEQESSRIIETTTTATVTHERYEPEEERHLVESRDYDADSGRNVSESPVASEKESHFVEEHIEPRFEQTQQRTSVTQEDSPVAQYFHEEPEHQTESPVPTEKAPLLTEQHQPESGDESDGEGFGSKVLGFAKKAGMVAGGVVAAPVALAAVGAKAAYDALKKDDDEDDEEEEKHALLGDSRERRVDSETQEPGATFYEPEEEDKVISETAEASSPKQEEPKIVFPVDSPAEQYVRDKTVFESMVQAEGPYIIESEDYEPSTQQEQRVSSPVPSDSDDIQTTPEQEQQVEDEEAQRHQETSETDAPYIIDSEEYEFSNREEQRISSPVHSDEEERDAARNDDVIETEAYGNDQQDDEVDPSIVESEEYLGSGQGSPRPFEDSTTTTVLSVHHEPPAIPEPEVDEEELGQDRSVIESGEYSSGSPLPPTTITTVEHVDPAEEHEYTPESPTTVTTVRSEHFEQHQDPSVVESEEYVKSSPIGHERPESPSGSPTHPDDYDDSHVIESQEYSGSPVPSEDSVKHVVEKTTTTTTTEEHFEPEDSSEDIQDYVRTTTTTTTVTREPEGEEHLVESHEYSASGSPVPSEKSVGHFIETTTTTIVTREHVEHEDHPSSHTGTEHFEQSSEQSESKSPVPPEEDVHGYMKTTTTTTTVTREHFDSEDETTGEHVVESEEYASGSPIPSEQESSRVIETITTTTTTREHFEPEEEQDPYHIVESQEYFSSGSPVPSERSVGHVIGTTSTTTVTREYVEPEGHEHSISGKQSPVHSEKSVEHVSETRSTTDESHSRFEPEEEKRSSPVPSEGEVHESMKTTSAITSESRYEPEHFQKEEEGDESDGEGFGSKVLGFAKKAGMVAGGVVAAPVALAAVGAKAAYDALKKDDDYEEHDQFHDQEHVQYDSAELHKQIPSIETHQEKDDSESEGSFVDHGEESQHLPLQSTEAAFKLSSEDVAEQTAEKLVSEVFSPLDRTLIESEQYRASIESLNRRSPVEPKRSVEDLASEALQNVTKISFGHADDSDDKHEDHDEEWKVYDRHGEILEEFSTQLTDDVIQEAEGDATTQIMMTQAEYSPRRSKFLKQESCQEISNEPEVDYYSDLQEKLNILAGEKNNLHALVEEEPSSSASDQLDVIHESDQEAHLEQEHEEEAAAQKEQEEKEEAAEYTATHLVDEVLQQVVHEIREEEDDQKTMTSDAYLTATEKDDQEYDTCVTSQDDTYESAQGWTSQDSEYTTATSQAPSRLSDSDGEHTARDRDQERQETSTPQAILSPVDSDRQFTVQQDFDMPVIRAFDPDDFMQTTARSTPDVALQVTIEEEDESDDKLPISPSGILLPPQHDPGRPISPVPPRKSDGTMKKEGDHFVFVREEDVTEPTPPPQLSEQTAADEARKQSEDTQITTETVPQEGEETEMRRQETERIHSLAMEASSDLGNSESSRYSRQLSDLSSSAESHADTVIRVESERSGSSDSLEVVSVISAGKDARTSEKSLTPEDPEKPLDVEQKPEGEEKEDQEAEDLGFEVYDADTEEQQQQALEELETVEEEPEDSDSLNEGGNHSSGHSSVGVPADTLAMIGKYRHQSSDNLSLTSLQEFERLEREVGARGDGSLTRSEIELLVAGRLNKSGEGSVSSLAEFERLEKEMTENQSPPEDVMMLSDIREESEAEDMSIRDDDEEDVVGSDTEMKSRPVQEEDLRGVTPVAPSPTDSLEHAIDPVQMQYLETSTDSLEPTFQEIEVEQRPDSVEDTSLTEYEMVPRIMEASTTDSLDGTATIEKDSLLEGASQGIESTQSTHGLLSGDTMGTLVTDDDRDSLDGEVSSMLQSYPTTLTTFQTTVVGPDGSLQTISRRVETRVTDPLVSHVTFTGTESQERLDQLPDDEQFETVDTEGNVTRTTFHREHDQPHSQF
ncbi:hypothetical protein GCK72_013633 [Caenorhabditis remanei]|uniref:Uncharacterized protein n=1 Tax=Caenorhabditis remanei TaxID=31234 RepID=A0A6A5GP28_CAERE|nr:hypothetical protein GCK72_013633 [Caenorhabditis remanei]KAF1757178.1 hypothetical protein GCK72_013633 [Caenorhabditis remanei]